MSRRPALEPTRGPLLLQAGDGAIIDILNRGYFRAAPDVASRLLRGDDVEASEYYFRTAPVFQTDAPAHRWLTEHQFIGLGRQLDVRTLAIDIHLVN